MSVGTTRAPGSTVRERRHAETMREIKAAALAQLAEHGAAKLSLRAVARDVGMTVQSLYHYLDSYDALITLLLVDSFHELSTAIEDSVSSTAGQPAVERSVAATLAYRRWALDHPAQFLLIFGPPLPGYAAPEETLAAAWRQGIAFREAVFSGWTTEEMRAIPLHIDREQLANWGVVGALLVQTPASGAMFDLPDGALAWFTEQRATMHGLVVLELLGQLGPASGEALMTDFCRRSAVEANRLRGR